MAVTTAALSGSIKDLGLEIPDNYLARVVLVVEANTPGSLLRDTSGNTLLAGAKRVAVDKTTGAFSQTLVTTNSADIQPADDRLYKATLIYPSGKPGAKNELVESGWFPFTADASLADAWQGIQVTAVSTALYESISMSVASAEASAVAAAAGAESSAASATLAQTLVTADLGTTDGQTWALLTDPNSQSFDAADTIAAARTYPRGEDQVSLGIPTDGTSDCLAALNAIPAGTGRVHLRGTFLTSGKVILQNRVQLVGVDARTTIIKAGAGFTDPCVVQLGAGTEAFGARLEHLTVDANSLAATAVIGLNLQESSGIEYALVAGWSAKGIDLTDGQNQNYSVREVEIYGTNAVGGVGMVTGAGSARRLDGITVIPAGAISVAAAAGTSGIILASPASHATGLHFEGCVTGLDLNGATGSSISGVTGVGGVGIVTDLVKVRNVAQDNISLQGLFPNGSTHAINDLLHGGYTYAGAMAIYAWSGGGVGPDNVLNIGDPAATPIA